MPLSQKLYTFLSYLRYKIIAKSRYGLHSPFVYKLLEEVLYSSKKYRIPEIEEIRLKLQIDNRKIIINDYKAKKLKVLPIRNTSRSSLSSARFSSFLYSLCNFLKIKTALETGTSFGLNALYLSKSNYIHKVVTIEKSEDIIAYARENFDIYGGNLIISILGDVYEVFNEALKKHSPELIFLDADHSAASMKHYFEHINKYLNGVKVIVIHDIYWSRDMTRFWKILINDKRYTLSIDLFFAGLLFPNIEMKKQHFTLKF